MVTCNYNENYLFLQVDNPVSILTQEMSKQFLQTKNEGDKYKVRKTIQHSHKTLKS